MPWPTNNAEFMAAIFGTTAGEVRPMVCAFEGDPGDKQRKGIWSGWPWSPAALADRAGMNWYFTLATYRPDPEGHYNRQYDWCALVHGVVLDDIGTKAAPRARLDALPPTMLTQTSEGNYQAVYLFSEPVADLASVDALQASLIDAGLCDPGAGGPTARWCRLPFGINGKYSPPHTCRLVEWEPQRRYALEQIARGLSLAPAAARVTPARAAPTVSEWDAMPPQQQASTFDDLRSALACVPSDDRRVWVDVGHYLRTLPEQLGFVLFDEWSRKSANFDEDGLAQFWTFDPKRSGYKAIFNLAKKHGWVNPRERQPAVIFAGHTDLPAGASLAPPPDAPKRRYHLLPEDPLNTARALIERRYSHAEGACLKAWQDGFYRWDASHWVEMTTPDARAQLYDFLDREGESFYRPNQSKVSNLLDALKAAAHLDSSHVAPCWISGPATSPPFDLVPCANGLLHLPTRSMLPATPRFFNMNAVPFGYEPSASHPTQWLHFLAQVWPNDPEAISTLQELFGYLLTPDTSQQKIFLIIGPKRSGKGTIARVLTEMLGIANVAGPSLASLAKDFGLQPLIGKQAAIISDARLGGQTDAKQVAENLLRVSGEDRVDVARKNTSSLSLRLGVRFVLLTNELPRIADASGAMASRFVILSMSESFLGREDSGLTNKLLRELPGVLAWAVDGWHRLNTRGHFVQPKSSAGAAAELEDLGSPIAAFVRDECLCAPHAEVETGKLFAAWRTWCALQGMQHSGTLQTFGRDLRAVVSELKQKQHRNPDGSRVRSYVGIALAGTQRHALHPICSARSTPTVQ